ncbi:hypothetical protein NIES2135_34530 [Leptolyngbya boryana NIES-2135]|jgi:hypothetical protein|uniref:Uncharacterized protein n=1 Tax=Leptolyngbya boryana NIES-2135 TaxID=1973484 RepID=A0A1Z4JIP7_LEPBY|nr:hypothetical protein NIES2135_34530 [Leptolyngbya boryana NIES-2135]
MLLNYHRGIWNWISLAREDERIERNSLPNSILARKSDASDPRLRIDAVRLSINVRISHVSIVIGTGEQVEDFQIRYNLVNPHTVILPNRQDDCVTNSQFLCAGFPKLDAITTNLLF